MVKRPEKNSERVEVRLPYTLKQRFLSACERAGETPSEALRDAMADYILRIEQAGKPTLFEEFTMKLIHNPLKAAGMTLASLSAFALMAAPSSADERLFNALDIDEDGEISALDLSETDQIVIKVLDTDHSETVTLDEFRLITRFGRFTPAGPIKVEANTVTVSQDHSQATYGGRVDLDIEPENKGFELRLPETETWSQTDLGLQHLEEGDAEGSVNIEFGDIQHASIVTLDLSEAGQVRLTSERVDWDSFDPADLGLVIVDSLGDAEMP